jgi:c-di-GMP-binding flagellar brake protein YcgR
VFGPAETTVGNVITMDGRTSKGGARNLNVRDRRYSIRYPFAADAELLDLESGARAEGVTSDISLGGVFVCSGKPLPLNSRTRITITKKNEKVEALASVRIVKPRIGMGVEFVDVEPPYDEVLSRWIEQLRKAR